ncbi:metal ABC transporter solute-binding protein, Zn/Mn family [Bacillus haikouensis]|uniref:metal ABC transporter solute-binding protein, Zn/Mn family n=1 Tax=Bacillus haikouensis TaxID=1510468 RepID=UPI001C12FB99|nr:zinc ABC transporter substrate-binding protein [Bacillus haikouensis]
MNYIRKSWLLLIVLFLSACGAASDENGEKDGKLDVYTTVYPIKDFTKKIGGEHVEVQSIYPPGADEHTFEPSQKDMIKMADGEIFFYVGMGLEGFVEKSKTILENEDVKVVPVSKDIEVEHEEAGHDEEEHAGDDHGHTEDEHAEGDHGHHHDVDPHIWLNPEYSKHMAEVIAETLSKTMPEHKEEFQSNLKDLNGDLDALDADFKKMAETAPNKTFYVSHAAYSYWEERYGLHQEAIAGLNTSDEPSQQELKKIIDQAKKDDVQYILFEQNVSSRLTEVVQKELGAKSLHLHNLSVLTEEDRDEDDDYFSLMRQNIETLKKALQ